jgi:phosphoserine aminotransferase
MGQFSAILFNLVIDADQPIDFVVSGAWSEKALKEAQRLGFKTNVVVDTKKSGHDGGLPILDIP